MTETVSAEKKEWNLSRKVITLFVVFYFLLYMFPEPFTEIPGVTELLSVYTKPMEWLILWFGKTILGITTLEKIAQTGSGDTTFDYVRLLVIFIISLLATTIVLLVSKKKEFQSWFNLTWIYSRYYLGLFLIVYGVIKLFEGQFGPPYIGRLEQNYGDSSPMGLLWTFMGHSKAYTFFGGLMELIAGLLLLFRRTTIAGALMAFGVMLNVAMMNYCYDVCVKLFSTHLVLLSILILSPYLKKLFQFIFQQKAVQLKIENLIFKEKWQRLTHKIFKIILLSLCAVMIIGMSIENATEYEDKDYSKSFDGSYEIKTFIKNGDTIPLLETDTLRWAKIVIEQGVFGFRTTNKTKTRFSVKTDTIHKKITLTSFDDSTKVYKFDYNRLPEQRVIFKGKYELDTLEIITQQKKKNEYLLNSTSFKWINEYPFNR